MSNEANESTTKSPNTGPDDTALDALQNTTHYAIILLSLLGTTAFLVDPETLLPRLAQMGEMFGGFGSTIISLAALIALIKLIRLQKKDFQHTIEELSKTSGSAEKQTQLLQEQLFNAIVEQYQSSVRATLKGFAKDDTWKDKFTSAFAESIVTLLNGNLNIKDARDKAKFLQTFTKEFVLSSITLSWAVQLLVDFYDRIEKTNGPQCMQSARRLINADLMDGTQRANLLLVTYYLKATANADDSHRYDKVMKNLEPGISDILLEALKKAQLVINESHKVIADDIVSFREDRKRELLQKMSEMQIAQSQSKP